MLICNMTRCDDCGDDVREVWRYSERNESMTQREVRWTCRDCNPDVDRPFEPVSTAAGGPSTGTERQPSG